LFAVILSASDEDAIEKSGLAGKNLNVNVLHLWGVEILSDRSRNLRSTPAKTAGVSR